MTSPEKVKARNTEVPIYEVARVVWKSSGAMEVGGAVEQLSTRETRGITTWGRNYLYDPRVLEPSSNLPSRPGSLRMNPI